MIFNLTLTFKQLANQLIFSAGKTSKLLIPKKTLYDFLTLAIFYYNLNPLYNLQLIGWKDGNSRLLVDVEEIECLNILSDLNEEAESINQLYSDHTPLYNSGSVWKEMVLSPLRPNIQMDLNAAILKSEADVAVS